MGQPVKFAAGGDGRGFKPCLNMLELFSLGFFGFLQWDNLDYLTVDTLHFEESNVAIFLEK